MDKLEMTPEQQLAFDGFIDVMVQIKIDYSKLDKDKGEPKTSDSSEDTAEA